ncbi:uncharacterized protein [Elaeis guineensis]|uniref:uncharacterized protein n=1 Tax=Elaeis guineensis var. tenera TaxID=51953 RepID=UPI003C6D0B63
MGLSGCLLPWEPSLAYNAILGQPSLGVLKAVVSSYHLMMKFPMEAGVGQVRGNQAMARQCFTAKLWVEEQSMENADLFVWTVVDMSGKTQRMILFGLKNGGATYQRLVNKIFKDQINRNMKIYVDDMLMQLNHTKRAFGVSFGKFLRFIVSRRGIEVNPEKIKAILEMSPSRNPRDFQWTIECQKAFEELKQYLNLAPLLIKPQLGEELLLYLVVSLSAISSVLIREGRIQKSVYYSSKVLQDTEISRSRQSFTVRTCRDVLQNGPYNSEFDIKFHPRPSIKAQVLVDFILECTIPDEEGSEAVESSSTVLEEQINMNLDLEDQWILHVDGSSNSSGSGVGVILTGSEGDVAEYALWFEFSATNNEAEYKALIIGLKTYKRCESQTLEGTSDTKYTGDALSKLAVFLPSEFQKGTYIEIEEEPYWIDPLLKYLRLDELPSDSWEAWKIRKQAVRYVLHDDKLYKRSFFLPLLRCLRSSKADYALREVHKEIYENHLGVKILSYKILRQGYYWPLMQKNASDFVRCDRCQKIFNVQHQPAVPLLSSLYDLSLSGEWTSWVSFLKPQTVQRLSTFENSVKILKLNNASPQSDTHRQMGRSK